MTNRTLFRINSNSKIHFSYEHYHTHNNMTNFGTPNECNILGWDIDTDGWEDAIVKMTLDEWDDAVASGKVCKKCLDGLDRNHSKMWLRWTIEAMTERRA